MAEKRKDRLSLIEEVRRNQMIDSAIKMIAELGFRNTTLDDIAANVNVSKGVITYHFKNKNELIQYVLDRIVDQQRANRQAWLDKATTPREKICAYIRADIALFEEYPLLVQAMVELWGSISSHEEKRAFEESTYRPSRVILEDILTEGQKQGEFVAFNPQVMATVMMGMIDGLMIQWVFDPSHVDIKSCGDELIQFVQSRIFAPDVDPSKKRK